MANENTQVPLDPDIDFNMFRNKYQDDDNSDENKLDIFDLTSPYSDLDNLHCNIIKPKTEKSTDHNYTTLHLNIHSLPAKIDNLKFIISELSEQNIAIDFILLCETFLTDYNSHQYNIPGYNFVYKNRINSTRGGVAIYINNNINLK